MALGLLACIGARGTACTRCPQPALHAPFVHVRGPAPPCAPPNPCRPHPPAPVPRASPRSHMLASIVEAKAHPDKPALEARLRSSRVTLPKLSASRSPSRLDDAALGSPTRSLELRPSALPEGVRLSEAGGGAVAGGGAADGAASSGPQEAGQGPAGEGGAERKEEGEAGAVSTSGSLRLEGGAAEAEGPSAAPQADAQDGALPSEQPNAAASQPEVPGALGYAVLT